MLKIKYKRAVLVIPNGETISNVPDLQLPNGMATAIACLNPNKANEPNEFVDLQVLENGGDVIEPMDYRFSERTIHGAHLDSYRQVNFDCGRTVQLKLTTKTAVAAELKVQVTIAIILPS